MDSNSESFSDNEDIFKNFEPLADYEVEQFRSNQYEESIECSKITSNNNNISNDTELINYYGSSIAEDKQLEMNADEKMLNTYTMKMRPRKLEKVWEASDSQAESITSGSEYEPPDLTTESDYCESASSEVIEVERIKLTGKEIVNPNVQVARLQDESSTDFSSSDEDFSKLEKNIKVQDDIVSTANVYIPNLEDISEPEISDDEVTIAKIDQKQSIENEKKNKENNFETVTKFQFVSPVDKTKFVNKLNQSSEVSGLSSLDNSMVDVNLKSVGPALRNKRTARLVHSRKGCKKNCCYYCLKNSILTKNDELKVLYTKLPEHYEKAHATEKVVVKLNNLKKELVKRDQNCQAFVKRKAILRKLRMKANYLNNLRAKKGKHYVVTRRPIKSKRKTISDFLPCYNCKQVYSVTSLRKHVNKCTGASFLKKHVVKSRGRATNGDYHEIASETSIHIISAMRETDAVSEIQYDLAVFVWLNGEAQKYETQPHNFKKVRANISRLGTLLKEMKKINANIKEVSDILNEDYYEDFIAAVKEMGKPHPGNKYMQSPATASDMFHLIKSVASIYDCTMCSKDKKKRNMIAAFEKKLNRLWHTNIGNTIAETQARALRLKQVELPDKEDSQLLHKFLLTDMQSSYSALKTEYTHHGYERLRNSILCYLQTTNAKRPGEVQRAQLDEYMAMTTDGKDCGIHLRGKRRRAVPLVFDEKIRIYLDFLISLRPRAGIFTTNPYIFATINDVSEEFYSVASAVDIIRKYSKECCAKKPETLRGTLIRKKVATDGLKKGINDREVQTLSDFLGHTPAIHRGSYRQRVFQRDVETSKQIKRAQGIPVDESSQGQSVGNELEVSQNMDHQYENDSFNQDSNLIHSSIVTHNHEKSKDQTSKTSGKISSNKKVSCTGASFLTIPGRSHNLPWGKESVVALLEKFPNIFNLKYKVPSAMILRDFLKKTQDPTLKLKTEPQLRTWIHTQRNKKKGKDDVPERNHIPSYIYTHFKEYIDSGKIPSHKRVVKFMANSPSTSTVTIQNIQDWVLLAHKKKNKDRNKIQDSQ